jgi:hypothetical protein
LVASPQAFVHALAFSYLVASPQSFNMAACEPSVTATESHTKKCMTCKWHYKEEDVTKQGEGKVRCMSCNRLKNRVGYLMSQDPDVKDQLAGLDKAKFNQEAAALFGDELKQKILASYEQTISTSKEVEFVGTGDWMDLEDLQTKYKGKPTRLAAIIKNTKKSMCPVGECELYEDMIFKSSSTLKTCDAIVHTRRSEVIDNPKKPKKGRVQADPTTSGQNQAECEKKLSPAQQETAKKWMKELEELADELKALVATIGEASPWNSYLPPWVQEKATEGEMKTREVGAMVELMCGPDGATSSFANEKANIAAVKKEGKEHVRRTTLQIQEAKLVMGFKDESPDDSIPPGQADPTPKGKAKGRAKAKGK